MAQPGTGHGAGPGAPLTDEARRLLDALPTASLLFDAEGRFFGLIGYGEERERAMDTLRRLMAA